MTTEIRRNNWSRFCRKFSVENLYRPARVRTGEYHDGGDSAGQCYPFLGVRLEKKGRLIDGIQLFAGREDVESIAEPVVSIKQPLKVLVEQDEGSDDTRLHIQARDGTEATVELFGEKSPSQQSGLVEKVAYSLYERRECAHGSDVGDWLEAERKIQEAELAVTK